MKKRIISFLTAAAVITSSIGSTGCSEGSGGGGAADESTTFTWWMAAAENAQYYTDYDDNPVVSYIEKFKTFENSEGEQVHINFDFQSGVSGSEQDNFNNMMATGTYTDIIDPTYYTGSIEDLYKEGTILDLTDYVNQYMPNYLKYIEDHPDLKRYFTTNIDGEEKYLGFTAVNEEMDMYDQWYGYQYRRDWIVKYGTQPDKFFDPREDSAPRDNPNAGKPFTGAYTLDKSGNTINSATCDDTVNGDSWVDDVMFPSGHPDPIYISDWEWMFEIFTRAMEAEGITDGYCLSVYYPGFLNVGDLVSGFGGIGPTWYIDTEGKCQFGAVSEGFRSYLACMNSWYNKGWLDKRFSERSGDPFYQIDDTSVRQGKIGLWLGMASELMTRMQNENLAGTEGIISYTCASPINDVYGADETKLKEPTCIFSNEILGGGILLTDKAKDKDIKVLCEYLDYLFTEEGILLMNGGLNQEQAAEANDPIYQSYGIDYAYTPVTGEDGKTNIDFVDIIYNDEGGIKSAMTGEKAWHMGAKTRQLKRDTETYVHMRENWVTYEAKGTILGLLNSRLTPDETKSWQKIQSRINSEYMYIEVPKFITGEKNLDSDFETFKSDLAKRNYQEVVDAYNRALSD